MDEWAVNVYRKEENAASLALRFLKACCQNIHLDILEANLGNGTKCASLGMCLLDLYSLNMSSKATYSSFYLQTNSNSISIITTKNRQQQVYDLLSQNQRQRNWSK